MAKRAKFFLRQIGPKWSKTDFLQKAFCSKSKGSHRRATLKSGSFGFFLLCIDRLRLLKLRLFSYLEWSERKVKKSKVVEEGKIYLHTKIWTSLNLNRTMYLGLRSRMKIKRILPLNLNRTR